MLTPGFSVLYLHGFASSPLSRKARFLEERFREKGIRFEAPDLAEGDFYHLTISKQLGIIGKAARSAGPIILVGSSLGGYLASLYAAEHKDVNQLILLAPAFGFHDLWVNRLGPEELHQWQESGKLPVFHYGLGAEADLSYDFLEDAKKHPPYPNSRVPTLIFHGTHDELVPLANSIRFVEEHSEARLVEMDSGHELTNVLDEIWAGIQGVLPPG
jgi:pimeloyl-ACP methyl ester carboxylesterase